MNSIAQETFFEDVASTVGIQGVTDLRQHGVAWGDYDNDGDLDLFVATNPANQLFHNNGDGSFMNIAASAGIEDNAFSASGGFWGDYDGDGYLDLYVCNLAEITAGDKVINRLYRNNGDGTFTDLAEEAGVTGHVDEEEQEEGEAHKEEVFTHAAWADYDRDDDLDLIVCNRFRGVILYQNQGDGSFLEVTQEAGLLIDHRHEETENSPLQEEQSFGVEHASWGDANGDGYLDLFLSIAVPEEDDDHEEPVAGKKMSILQENDSEITENRFFINNGDGTFTDRTDEAGFGEPNLAVSFSSVWGDYDNDGDLDLFVGNIGSANEGTAVNSHLYRNNGDGTFTDVAELAGIIDEIYAFSAVWADMNNDGWLDLSIIYHPDHADFQAGDFFIKPHPLYLSNADGTFTNINAETDQALFETGVMDISHLIGLAWADYDSDGALDFVITENHADGPIRLYRNQTTTLGNHWLQIDLQQEGSNSFSIGARVTANAENLTQIRHVGIGNQGWATQNPNRVHFGLGSISSAMVSVQWTDGSTETFGTLEADRIHKLVKGQGTLTTVQDWMRFDRR